MAGQHSHMPHGGSPNPCHTPGPAHPPDPQVSPLPLSAVHWSVSGEHGSLGCSVRPGCWRKPLLVCFQRREQSSLPNLLSPSFHLASPCWTLGGMPGLALPLGVSMDQRCLEGWGGRGGCGRPRNGGMGRTFLGSERASLLWAEVCLPLWSEPCSGLFSLFIQTPLSSGTPVSFHLDPWRARQPFAALPKVVSGVLSCRHTPRLCTCCSQGLECPALQTSVQMPQLLGSLPVPPHPPSVLPPHLGTGSGSWP